jgi:hypothetical protein
LVSNGLDALEPGLDADDLREAASELESLSGKCNDLQRRKKSMASLSQTNQRRLQVSDLFPFLPLKKIYQHLQEFDFTAH